MQKGKLYLERTDKTTFRENRSFAQTHFLNALQILNDTRADPSEFIQVYNGLMHVHLDLTFQSGLSIEEREEHLRTAMEYNNQYWEIAQRSPVGEMGVLAQVKLQQAVLFGREVQLRAKRGGNSRSGGDLMVLKDSAIDGIEQALRELLESNHRSKEKSILWGRDWQDRLKKV